MTSSGLNYGEMVTLTLGHSAQKCLQSPQTVPKYQAAALKECLYRTIFWFGHLKIIIASDRSNFSWGWKMNFRRHHPRRRVQPNHPEPPNEAWLELLLGRAVPLLHAPEPQRQAGLKESDQEDSWHRWDEENFKNNECKEIFHDMRYLRPLFVYLRRLITSDNGTMDTFETIQNDHTLQQRFRLFKRTKQLLFSPPTYELEWSNRASSENKFRC